MRISPLLAGVLLLSACTTDADPVRTTAQSTIPPSTSEPSTSPFVPPLALLDVRLTCDDKNERRPRATVRGRAVGLARGTSYEVSAVQGTDAELGHATVSDGNSAGEASFSVPVVGLLPDAPVRIGLRVAGIVSLTARSEVTRDPATCAFAGTR